VLNTCYDDLKEAQRFTEALPLLEELVQLTTESQGEEDPSSVLLLNELAMTCVSYGYQVANLRCSWLTPEFCLRWTDDQVVLRSPRTPSCCASPA